ncbi:UDP-glycosyltransferase 76C2-like isoform X2 [Phragmites australis]|uniref:UDP-glycosyltransferase 76C2-like isoform X2 n=1 Tax=Phragmites australis TaxID=29695 RepID=UPI002D77D730|nr:UDP-glycosyltransferase 76C2-like isoform X2 [Phragmites australis]
MAGPARRARVVLFPLPFQGHISPMLQLAGALHARGLAVTVLHTFFNAPDPKRHLGFSFVAVPDAIPNAVAATNNGIAKILALNAAMETSGLVRDALASLLKSGEEEEEPRLACLVIDSTLTATQKAATSLGLPTLVLHTGSAACFRLFRSYDMLHDKGYLPETESNLHLPVKELPPLKVRDLFDPSKLPNKEIGQKILNLATETTTNSSGAILNTFEALEARELEMIQDELADRIPAFAVGPLHKLTSVDGAQTSLLNQDRSCIEWLDTQAPGSVLYVSFGSVVHVTQDEFMEVAWGLAYSGRPFLWVVRRGLVLGVEKPELPEGFESMVEGKGKVIEWAAQQEVLAHSAVGGFWTHNGWNSTLESICEGVPMLSSPLFGDQLATGRYVQDMWKIGILLEGVLERVKIEKAVRTLLDENEGMEIRDRARDLRNKVQMCLDSSGSSRQAVDKLVHHILSL